MDAFYSFGVQVFVFVLLLFIFLFFSVLEGSVCLVLGYFASIILTFYFNVNVTIGWRGIISEEYVCVYVIKKQSA